MEVISPWTLYWILQLDSIIFMSFFMAIPAASTALILGVAGCAEKSASNISPECETSKRERARGELFHRIAWKLTIFAATVLLVVGFTPSTKNMAAIVVIPAIANSETVQAEAGELYGLAKQALRNAVDADDAPVPMEE